jgi:predicted permease
MIATLVLGIGLSTAIFSLFYSLLLQPLPYPHPERLVALWTTTPARGSSRLNVGAANWRDWRAQSRLFEDIALTRPVANYNLTGSGPPERLFGARTSWNLPQVLGVRPWMGRTFTEAEQRAGANVAVLSYRLWLRRFGGDHGLLGRKIQLNSAPFEVIGVMPPEYCYPTRDFELWTPLFIRPDEFQTRLGYDYISVGRLKAGVTVAQAQAEISAIMQRLARQYPEIGTVFGPHDAVVEPLLASTVSQAREPLHVLLGAVGLLLLIGCMNLSLLLLARASARAQEMAVRTAIGAGRWRLVRQMLAELVPLSVAGAAGGVLLAWWMVRAIVPFLPAGMPRVEAVRLHPAALAFAVAAGVFSVFGAGLWPARLAAAGSRTMTARSYGRNLLVVAQVALASVLLFGEALFVRSLAALLKVQPGFTTQGILTMHLAVTRARHPEDRQVADYYDRIAERVRTVPGVSAAGIVNRLPLSGTAQTGPVEFEGKPEAGIVDTDWRSATRGYFEAIGIPLVRGSVFTGRERETTQPVGLIDEHLARKVFGNQDPVGRRFRISAGTVRGPWTGIVGVVGHILHESLEKDVRPQVYWPEAQRAQDRAALVVRTAGHPASFAPAVVQQIRALDPEQTVYDVRSMDEWVERSLSTRNLVTSLVGLFGGASLALACLGLYGVVSYTARLRLREFGIRMALGAAPAHVRRLVLRHALRLAVWGAAAGLVLTWPAGAALHRFVYGVSTMDAAALAVVPAVLLGAALLASLAPARRAASADPALTLRAE